jgi:hypothetical protein
VKLIVEDGTGDAIFVLFDNDVHYLLEKQCASLVANSKVCPIFCVSVIFWLYDILCEMMGAVCCGFVSIPLCETNA